VREILDIGLEIDHLRYDWRLTDWLELSCAVSATSLMDPAASMTWGRAAMARLGGRLLVPHHWWCSVLDSGRVVRSRCASGGNFLYEQNYQVAKIAQVRLFETTIFVYTINKMHYEFDPAKDESNLDKYGVSLADADEFEWEAAVVREDMREQYAEPRFEAKGYIGVRLHVMVFCIRDDVVRVISLRKANPREVKSYAET